MLVFYCVSGSAGGVNTVPSGVPGSPTITSVVPIPGGARVSFDAPASSGDSNVGWYLMTAQPGSITVNVTGSPAEVTGLVDGVEYTFTVVGGNSQGTGTSSAASASFVAGTSFLLLFMFFVVCLFLLGVLIHVVCVFRVRRAWWSHGDFGGSRRRPSHVEFHSSCQHWRFCHHQLHGDQ